MSQDDGSLPNARNANVDRLAGKFRAFAAELKSADHPHTDPGDGRSECQTCGKWVWPFTHSCKGVPVTEAAWARAGQVPEPKEAQR